MKIGDRVEVINPNKKKVTGVVEKFLGFDHLKNEDVVRVKFDNTNFIPPHMAYGVSELKVLPSLNRTFGPFPLFPPPIIQEIKLDLELDLGEKAEKKCECGAYKIRGSENFHSDWCPKYKEKE